MTAPLPPGSSSPADWGYPTPIRFGAGRVVELGAACREVGIERPLIVTDPGLAALPVIDTVRAALEPLAHATFHDLKPNPVGRDVDAGVRAYRDGDHDGVVAVGGGSALDVGKVIAFMAGQSRPLWDFEDIGDQWTRADAAAIAPVITVPTTAGTGSEVGRAGVVIDEATHRKVIVFHPAMLPRMVICDPELTVGLPRTLTVGTGLDAGSGVGVFLAVLLHKPLDAMSITTIMAAGGWSRRARAITNLVFAVLCPLGAMLFFFGLDFLGNDSAYPVAAALAFSAGTFICIALSDLLPEVHFHSHDRGKLTVAFLLGIGVAYAIGALEPANFHLPNP